MATDLVTAPGRAPVLPIAADTHDAHEQAVAAAVRAIEEEIQPRYVAVIGPNAYRVVTTAQLGELPAGTQLIARISGTTHTDRVQVTAGTLAARLDALLRAMLGPRPQRAGPPRWRAQAPTPQPCTADVAHAAAEQWGGV